MPRSKRPIRIAEGITRDGDRYVATVRIGPDGPDQLSDRKIFDLKTNITKIQAWRHTRKGELLELQPRAVAAGSLAADIAAWVASLPEDQNGSRYREDSEDLLNAWAETTIADLPRQAITRVDIQAQITTWLNAGVAASTIKRRLSRLRVMYHALDGDDTPTPIDGVKRPKAPPTEARDIPPEIVALILDSIPDIGRAKAGETRPPFSESKIRLRVMAWIGHAQETIVGLTPRSIDLRDPDHPRIFLPDRNKGKGVPARWVDMLPQAVAALEDFGAAGLWGKRWSNSSVGDAWRGGIARAKAKAQAAGAKAWIEALKHLPPNCKPYDLRHSFGTEVYRRTGDLRAVNELMQHSEKSLATTARYAKGAVSDRVRSAIAATATALANLPTLPPAAKATPALRLVRRS